MTPEERAASIMTQLACKRGQEVGWEPHTGREDAWIEASIADVIRSAVAAEREECAQLIERWPDTMGIMIAPEKIPAAIRARNEKASCLDNNMDKP